MNHLLRSRYVMLSGILTVAVVVAGCADEPEVPPAQSQAAVTREVDRPATVTGCLKAGDAANTYVLTTAQSVEGTPPATYHLTGTHDLNLQDHVGSRIEATGVIKSQSEIASRQPAEPARTAEEPTATSGTPVVQTGTELSIRRMEVTAVKALAGDCEL